MTRVHYFYDQITSTFTYVVSYAETGVAAIILPPIDASGRLSLKVPINAFDGTAPDRFASKE